MARNTRLHLRTRARRIDLLNGKLSLLFLNSLGPDLTSLIFGEQFVALLYDGVAVDPGSTRMRRALDRHLRRLPEGAISAIAATHHHEEHSGNLGWLARRTGAPLYVGEATARLLDPPARLPFIRRLIIGQPPRLEPPWQLLPRRLPTASRELEVILTPGHCPDHLALYDRAEKLLLAGDAFMGVYFSAPNPDVDSARWIETLRGLLTYDIEILVEGHGFIYTLRPDVPDIRGLVFRRHPRELLEEKLHFFEWLRSQVESGAAEGLPLRAIEVTCFPWSRSFAWEKFLNDELSRMLSLGHWSRTELVRSFVRDREQDVFPTVWRARFYR